MQVPAEDPEESPSCSSEWSARKLAEIPSIASHQTARCLPRIDCSVSLPAAYECQIEAAIEEAWLHTTISVSKRKWASPLSINMMIYDDYYTTWVF